MRAFGARQSPRARAFRLGRQSFRFSSGRAVRVMAAGYQTVAGDCKTCRISSR
jgi:hypothetical protein